MKIFDIIENYCNFSINKMNKSRIYIRTTNGSAVCIATSHIVAIEQPEVESDPNAETQLMRIQTTQGVYTTRMSLDRCNEILDSLP